MHIYFSRSQDGGASWSPPSRIDWGNPNDAWEPSVSVDPSNGRVTVAWYDRRDDPNNAFYRTYYTQSSDGGSTFLAAQQPVSDARSDPRLDCNATGDYMMLASRAGQAHPVWSDTRNGRNQVFTRTLDEASYPEPLPADNRNHLYVLDGWGGIHPTAGSPGVQGTGYSAGRDTYRGITLFPDGSGGYTLDGFGGIHGFGSAPGISSGVSWPWDIARAIQLAPWSSQSEPQGWVVDGFGGIHPFGGAPAIPTSAYWNGWDIVRGFAVLPDSSRTSVGGYVLDGLGGVHAVGNAPPIYSSGWPWDIARGIAMRPHASHSNTDPQHYGPQGYVLDGWGGIHAFGGAPPENVGGWPGWDIAKSLVLWSGDNGGGWVLDGFGGMNAYGGAPGVTPTGYWNGWDIARSSAGSGSGNGGRRPG
jgi:hypothetical protein